MSKGKLDARGCDRRGQPEREGRSFWPDIQREPMDGVDIVIRYRPSAAATSRSEEFMYGWLLDHVKDEERRIILGRWAMCLAAPRIGGSFRDFCQKTGRVRVGRQSAGFKMNFKAFRAHDPDSQTSQR